MMKIIPSKGRTKFKQSLLQKYFISYAGFTLLISGILCLVLSGMSVHMLRGQSMAAAQEKLAILTADMESQFVQMQTSALKISYNSLYRYQQIKRHPYNEILMLENFKLMKDQIPVVDDYCIIYHGDRYVYRSNGRKTERKLWLDSVSDEDTLYEEMMNAPRFRILEGKNNTALYCFPIRLGMTGETNASGEQNRACVIFLVTGNTLCKRFTTLAGEMSGEVRVSYLDEAGEARELACFQKEIPAVARRVRLTSVSGNGHFYISWELPDPYRNILSLLTSNRATTLIMSVLLMGFICFSVVLTYLNFRPIREAANQVKEMSENLSLTKGSRELYKNEVESIVDGYKELLLRLHYENQAAEDKQLSINALNAQMTAIQSRLKNQFLQLLLHGKLQPASMEDLSCDLFMNVRLQGPFYSMMLLRCQENESMNTGSVNRLIEKIEQYSDEKLSLNCADMICRVAEKANARVIAVVVSMCETELMDDAREYVTLALEEIFPQAQEKDFSCIDSPLFCERLEQLPDVFEKTVGLLWNGNSDRNMRESTVLSAHVGSEGLKKRLQTAIRLGRVREAHNCLDMILEESRFSEAAFSEQRYITYILWNLLCETACGLNQSIPAVPTGALLSFEQPGQLTGHLHMLIDYIEQHISAGEGTDEEHHESMQSEAEKIIAYLEQNFTDCDLTLNSLSEQFGLNPRRVSLLIKQKNGMNYQDYLTGLRIGLAQKLLLGSEQSVTEICSQIGYSNLPHFVRTFKQVTGYTPTMYRKNSENRNLANGEAQNIL